MKKGNFVLVSLIFCFVLVLLIALIYAAMFSDLNQDNFDLGTYSNTTYNGSAVVLSGSNLTGTYISRIFDAGTDAVWNNLSYLGVTLSLPVLYAVDVQSDFWKSSDSGISWNLVKDDYNGGEGNGATDLEKNSTRLFLLFNQDLWTSLDRGLTWVKINDDYNGAEGQNGDVLGIDSNNYIYIIEGDQDVWRSTDGGVTFSKLISNFNGGNGVVFGLVINNSGAISVVDGASDVWNSLDQGVTWNLVKDDFNGGIGNNADDMAMDSNNNLYIIDRQDFWSSTDNGVSWTLVNDDINGAGDSNDGLVAYIDEQNNIYVVDGSEDVLRSVNGGVIFIKVNDTNFNGGNGNVFGLNSVLDYTNLSFQVKNCTQVDCSDGGWQGVNQASFSLQGRYFQYKVDFTTPSSSITPSVYNVSIGYALLNSAPAITLIEPQNTLYLANESLNLTYTVSDSDGNLDACWYWLDNGLNISLTGCVNTTFSTSQGSHNLKIYTNDTYGKLGSDNVSFDIDATGVAITINEPSGAKLSRTGIPINVGVVGDNVSCIYNVYRGTNLEVANTSISCSNGSISGDFGVTIDADFVFNVYANNTFGSKDNASSSFSVSTSSGTSGGGGGGGGGGGSTTIIQQTPEATISLTLASIYDLIVNPGDSKKITLSAKNTGTVFLNDCKIESTGSYADWLSVSGTKSLSAGEEYNFVFDLKVPDNARADEYELGVALTCKEISDGVSFNAEIIEQKIGLKLIDVKRAGADMVRIVYSLEELSGTDQTVELQFLLYNSDDEKVAEMIEQRTISANSLAEFETLLPIASNLKGDFNLLINLNSEIYSTFIQENIFLTPTGLAIFGGEVGTRDAFITGVIILVFVIFAFFMIRRILKLRRYHLAKLGIVNRKRFKK